MIITEPGRYQFSEDFSIRGAMSRKEVKAGTIIKITQVDKQSHKVMGPDLLDWIFWDLPCKRAC